MKAIQTKQLVWAAVLGEAAPGVTPGHVIHSATPRELALPMKNFMGRAQAGQEGWKAPSESSMSAVLQIYHYIWHNVQPSDAGIGAIDLPWTGGTGRILRILALLSRGRGYQIPLSRSRIRKAMETEFRTTKLQHLFDIEDLDLRAVPLSSTDLTSLIRGSDSERNRVHHTGNMPMSDLINAQKLLQVLPLGATILSPSMDDLEKVVGSMPGPDSTAPHPLVLVLDRRGWAVAGDHYVSKNNPLHPIRVRGSDGRVQWSCDIKLICPIPGATIIPDRVQEWSNPSVTAPGAFFQAYGASAPTPTPTPTQGDTMDTDNLIQTLNKVPKLVEENRQLKNALSEAEKATAEAVAKAKAEADKAITEAVAKAKAEAAAAASSAPRLDINDVSDADSKNSLGAIARKLNVAEDELRGQIVAFRRSCAIRLTNDVAWPDWCHPSDPTTTAAFAVRHALPLAVTGPSGTGKTFILEALLHRIHGARCLISYHESLSYPKLFLKEQVGAGKTYWRLGPVPMAALAGVPVVHDEFDHADVFVQSLVHSIIDTGEVHLPELGLTIYPADGFKHLFTCNSLSDGEGNYSGEVGTALRTRFGAVYVGYPDVDTEAGTVATASGIDKNRAKYIAGIFASLRRAEDEQRLTGPFSVRESCAVAKYIVLSEADGVGAHTAMAAAFARYVIDKRSPDEQAVAREVMVHSEARVGGDEGWLDAVRSMIDGLNASQWA